MICYFCPFISTVLGVFSSKVVQQRTQFGPFIAPRAPISKTNDNEVHNPDKFVYKVRAWCGFALFKMLAATYFSVPSISNSQLPALSTWQTLLDEWKRKPPLTGVIPHPTYIVFQVFRQLIPLAFFFSL